MSAAELRMSSVQNLRELINQRLTAAAEEIFTEFEKTIVQYEEEIDRQRRLLDNIWKPEITLQIPEPPQKHVCMEEKNLTVQQLCNQERNSSLDQEDAEHSQIKEEQEEPCTNVHQEDLEVSKVKEEQKELCTSLEQEQLVLKQETDLSMVTPMYEDSNHSEPEPNNDQLLSHNSPVAESQDQEGSKYVDFGSARNAALMPKMRLHRNSSNITNADNCPVVESHGNTYIGKKSVNCDVCGKAFKDSYKMKRHHRIHTGEKPYACNTCGKRFRSNDKLLVHMRTHTDERPYSCNSCGKLYKDASTLKVHTRSHTGEKPYACSICERRFKVISTLKTHMRTHTGERPYFCEICGKSFIQRSNLNVHRRRHTGEKSYS
ncbi:zinc finger protein 892-like [Amphiprion ocellaris]|uniref:zinc finger protein 892-like n=1 Tax=Amphiprion ocellaris TaxID=80972 RepID=UPI000C30E0E7|nr:zinc finger protein 892-like [Amphiprion ocellaris]